MGADFLHLHAINAGHRAHCRDNTIKICQLGLSSVAVSALYFLLSHAWQSCANKLLQGQYLHMKVRLDYKINIPQGFFCCPSCRFQPTAVVALWMHFSAAAHLAYLTVTAHAVRRAVCWTGPVGVVPGAHWMPVVCVMAMARQLMWKEFAAMPH